MKRRGLTEAGACALRPTGFTLIELVVVLAVLAVVAAVAIPALRPPVGADDRTDVERLVHQARLRALRTGSDVELIVDPDAGRYWLIDGEGAEVSAGAVIEFDGIGVESSRVRMRVTRTGDIERLPEEG